MADDKNIRRKILELRNKGLSFGAVAKTLGISKPNVKYHLKMAVAEAKMEEALALKKEYGQKLLALQKREQELNELEKRIKLEARKIYEKELIELKQKIYKMRETL